MILVGMDGGMSIWIVPEDVDGERPVRAIPEAEGAGGFPSFRLKDEGDNEEF